MGTPLARAATVPLSSETSPAVLSWEMEVVPTAISVLAQAAVGFDGGAGDIRRVWESGNATTLGDFDRLGHPTGCAHRKQSLAARSSIGTQTSQVRLLL